MLLLNWFYCLSNPTCTEKDNTRIDDNIIYGTQIWRVCFCYKIYRPLWYRYWHGSTWIPIIQNNRCPFFKLTQLNGKLYPIIFLINIYVNIPNSRNILSKAVSFLFKKIDTYTEVILWLSGFVDSSFWPTLLFKVSLQNVLPVKGVEIYINHQNFSLTSIIGLLP